MHLFQCTDKKTVLWNFTPGYGQVELAALRKDVTCISFVVNSDHRRLLEQRLKLAIMIEGLRGETTLLRGRRVLSTHRSIEGAHSTGQASQALQDSEVEGKAGSKEDDEGLDGEAEGEASDADTIV